MNNDFTYFTEYQILKLLPSGDGFSSLKHKLDCRIAESNAMVSHLPNINLVQKDDSNRIAQVIALTYIPFGKRGKRYVTNILNKLNKTFEENSKEHILNVINEETIDEFDIEVITLGTKHYELDLMNLPNPAYDNLPHFMFEFEELLDELNRSQLWPSNPKLSTRNNIMQYICVHMERTNKIVLPEELLNILTSQQFIDFENSNLTELEENYLKEYLNKVNFFSYI